MRSDKSYEISTEVSGPLVDYYQMYLCHPILLYRAAIDKIAEYLRESGMELRHRALRAKNPEHFYALAEHVHRDGYRLAFILSGNAIVYLRRLWEPQSKKFEANSFDGNVNNFDDPELYHRSDGLQLQLEFIQTQIERGVDMLKAALGFAGCNDQLIVMKLQRIELAWHHTCADGVESYLAQRGAQMRAANPAVNLGGLDRTGKARGFRVDTIKKGVEAGVYQKSFQVVREEVRLQEAFFDEFKKVHPDSGVREQLKWFVHHASTYREKAFAGLEPETEGLTHAEAFSALSELCPRRQVKAVLAALRAGTGIIVAKSSNGKLYRAVRQLAANGVMVKLPVPKSAYRLSPKYHAILTDAPNTKPDAVPESHQSEEERNVAQKT